jgi:hypothetical protein
MLISLDEMKEVFVIWSAEDHHADDATPTFLRLPTAVSPRETSELDSDPFNE